MLLMLAVFKLPKLEMNVCAIYLSLKHGFFNYVLDLYFVLLKLLFLCGLTWLNEILNKDCKKKQTAMPFNQIPEQGSPTSGI